MKAFSISYPKNGKRFRVGAVTEAIGTHTLNPDSHVWAILNDTYCNNYLQNPPLMIDADGAWRATNIHLGEDIIRILFVMVTHEGHQFFLGKAENNEWGAFSGFPAGSKELGSVRIKVK